MNLRDMMKERILFCMTEAQLQQQFEIASNEISELSDLDFLELYESICFPELMN